MYKDTVKRFSITHAAGRDFVFAAIVQGMNLFLTGAAGTGKRYCLKAVLWAFDQLGVACRVTAPTLLGARSVAAQGSSLHHCLHIPETTPAPWHTAAGCVSKHMGRNRSAEASLRAIWRNTQWLVIHQVHMVQASTLWYAHHMLCRVRDCKLPFGGIKLVSKHTQHSTMLRTPFTLAPPRYTPDHCW